MLHIFIWTVSVFCCLFYNCCQFVISIYIIAVAFNNNYTLLHFDVDNCLTVFIVSVEHLVFY